MTKAKIDLASLRSKFTTEILKKNRNVSYKLTALQVQDIESTTGHFYRGKAMAPRILVNPLGSLYFIGPVSK